ncbi:MAG: HAD-IB family hydrolase [bacterium]|nr:HAD-IB family hydrolase [bacterium]
MKKKRKFAIFDIDGTIFRSSLLIELTEGMIHRGIFKPRVRNVYTKAYKKWLDRKGPYGEYINAVVKAFETNIKGVPAKAFFKISKQVADFHKDRTYRYTRQLITDLKKKGYYLLAISHSPLSVLQDFCRKIGFDKVYGRVHEVNKNGKLTGDTMHLELISDKAKILQRAIEKENLTLKDSVGVGDTETDIRFLEIVKNPICFNPNSGLYRHAKKAGWKVVVERKDVVFEL